eukprot:366018-Chlamydomonas_euryale.AAC.3
MHCQRCTVKDARQRCTVKDALTKMHGQQCTVKDALSKMHWERCTDKEALTKMHWRQCTVKDALSKVHCQRCTDRDARATMHCQRCTVKDALSKMHWERCTDKEALAKMRWQRCTNTDARVETSAPSRSVTGAGNRQSDQAHDAGHLHAATAAYLLPRLYLRRGTSLKLEHCQAAAGHWRCGVLANDADQCLVRRRQASLFRERQAACWRVGRDRQPAGVSGETGSPPACREKQAARRRVGRDRQPAGVPGQTGSPPACREGQAARRRGRGLPFIVRRHALPAVHNAYTDSSSHRLRPRTLFIAPLCHTARSYVVPSGLALFFSLTMAGPVNQ